jgi:D-3-phosphoglycerate dehydrogenase
MVYKVLIATRSFGSTSQKPWDVLAEAGCDVSRADMSKKMTEERLIDLLKGMDGVIVGVVPMTARVLENAPDLKVVGAHGVGVDHIDLDAASRLGITIANCPGANDPSVADLTIGLMIAVARSIPRVEQELRQGGWGRYQGGELWEKTLGLIGLGRIGRGVAKRASGFDMEVMVYDPYVEKDQKQLTGVKFDSFENVIKQSDFLSLHTPLNDETRNMISSAELTAMKPGAYLINTARGGLVDEQALFKALTEKQITGAAFDVFLEEPPGNSPLLGLDNMIATPHIGAHTQESIERMGVMAAQGVVATLQGGQPPHRVR